MSRSTGRAPAKISRLFLTCLIACGIPPLAKAAPPTPLTLQISTETAPPSGWAQFKISATTPTLIASGELSMDFDPTVFGPIAQVTAFSSTGDQLGYAMMNGLHLDVSFSSPSAGLGQLPELPVLVVTVPVLASAKPGTTVSISGIPTILNYMPGPWIDQLNNLYSVTISPSTFTVGGGLSVQAVTPGGGLLPAGTVIQITGTGFDATTTVAIDGVSISRTVFIGPGQINVTLGGATEMTGKHVHVSNSTGAQLDYYAASPSAPADPGQGFTTLPDVTPILPLTTYAGSEMYDALLTVAGSWGFAMLNPNLTPATVTFEAFQTNGPNVVQTLFVETIEIPPGQLYLLDATSMLQSLELSGQLWMTFSVPIRFINIRNAIPAGAGISAYLPNLAVGSPPLVQVTLPASTGSVAWSWQQGSPALTPAKVTLLGSFDFTTTISTPGGKWLSVSAVKSGASSALTLTPDPSMLGAGTYSGTVTVTPVAPPPLTGAAIVPTVINVSLTVSVLPLISVFPAPCCLFYEIVPNQPAGPPGFLNVSTNGDPAQITVSFSTSSGNWLKVSPLSGTTPLQLTVTADPSGSNLPPGSYSGQITIQGPGNTVTVSVGMNVVAPPSSPPGTPLRINGPPPAFTLSEGAAPMLGGSTFLSFQQFDVALTSVTTDVTWLKATIEGPGPSPPQAPAGIQLDVNDVGLTAGTYSGTITINSSNYPVLQVPATLTVIAAANAQTMITATPASLSFTAPSGALSPSQQLTINFNNGPVDFKFSPTPQWLQLSPVDDFTAAHPVYSFLALASNLPPGGYYCGLVISWTTGSITVPVTFNVTSTATFPPIITSVLSAASLTPRSIAPGEIITILGTGVGPPPTGLTFDPSGKLATVLGGTQVLIGGKPAPLIYASASQVNAIVPFEVGNTGTTTLQVISGGQASATWEIPVSPSAPSIFTSSATGIGQAAVLNQDNTVNSPSNPAAPGSVIQIYATGGGTTAPAGSTGALALPGEKLALPVTVTIGGVGAAVQYAGSATGEVEGLIQINAVVPLTVAAGASVPIQLTIGNSASQNGATIAVNTR